MLDRAEESGTYEKLKLNKVMNDIINDGRFLDVMKDKQKQKIKREHLKVIEPIGRFTAS